MRIPLNDLRRGTMAHAQALGQAIDQVVASGSYVLGEAVTRFEREFAHYCGAAHCVGVASGSDALEIALRAVGITPDHDVVTVANAAMYSTLAIRAVGARPFYVDIDPTTLTMSATSLQGALGRRPGAVIVTHLYGRLADIGAIGELAERAGVPVIEDCAQAHGARAHGIRAGSFGNLSCFSFYPTKNLGALGDGGAVTTNDSSLAARVRALRQYGWLQKYEVTLAGGRNSRLDELQAAVLSAKLPHLDTANARRRAIARAYSERILHPHLRKPAIEGENHVAHLYVIQTGDRESLRSHLTEGGVGCAVHYPIPDHRQPVMGGTYETTCLPITERACREVLTLPCFPELTESEVEHVIAICNAWAL